MRRQTLWALTLLLLVGCRNIEKVEPPISQRDYLTVRTQRVKRADSSSDVLEFSGHLRASRKTLVGFLRPGRLQGVFVDEGDRVVEGDLLAQLDTRSIVAREGELRAELAEAQAASAVLEAPPRTFEKAAAENQVKEVESNLNLVQTKLRRRESLFQEGAIAREQVDELASQEKSLINQLKAAQNRVRDLEAGAIPQTRRGGKARVENVRASLESLQVDLADSELRAPYEGTISKRLRDEGAILNTGEPVFELLTSGALEAEIFLPPDKARSLTSMPTVDLFTEGKTYPAKLTKLLPTVSTDSGTQAVLLSLPPNPELKAGQLVRVKLASEQVRDGYWIPTTALLPGERGLFVCYTLSAVAGEPELFEVKKQAVEVVSTDGDRSFVRGTLVNEPELLVEGVQRVVPGQKVRRE